MIRRRVFSFLAIVGTAALLAFGSVRLMRTIDTPADTPVPATAARRTSVIFSITAKGDLQGGSSKMMAAPMTGSPQLVLTDLRKPGELVQESDIVAQFDTTEESFK